MGLRDIIEMVLGGIAILALLASRLQQRGGRLLAGVVVGLIAAVMVFLYWATATIAQRSTPLADFAGLLIVGLAALALLVFVATIGLAIILRIFAPERLTRGFWAADNQPMPQWIGWLFILGSISRVGGGFGRGGGFGGFGGGRSGGGGASGGL